MKQRNLKLNLEQAKRLLKTNPELKETIYNSFPELKPKLIVPDSWGSLDLLEGYYIDAGSNISITTCSYRSYAHRNVATTEKHCLSMLAFAQLSQLMKATGDCDIDWDDEDQAKYCIIRKGLELTKFDAHVTYYYLAFKTESIRDEFFEKHIELIKQYYML